MVLVSGFVLVLLVYLQQRQLFPQSGAEYLCFTVWIHETICKTPLVGRIFFSMVYVYFCYLCFALKLLVQVADGILYVNDKGKYFMKIASSL